MKKMWISGVYAKPRTTISNPQRTKHPYLLKGMKITRPNQVWTVDITYVRMRTWWVYLFAIIDLYSRAVVGWDTHVTLEASWCVDCLRRTLASWVKPEIVNSDQWVQFTSNDWITTLQDYDVRISMAGRGRCYDNIHVERVRRTVKQEEVYLKSYDSPRQAHQELEAYINFYNHQRVHSQLWYNTPRTIYSENGQQIQKTKSLLPKHLYQSFLKTLTIGLEKGTT